MSKAKLTDGDGWHPRGKKNVKYMNFTVKVEALPGDTEDIDTQIADYLDEVNLDVFGDRDIMAEKAEA